MPVRPACPADLNKLAAVERSAASVFRDAGLDWLADGDTMDPAVLAKACSDGTLWVAVDDGDEPVGFLAAHRLGDGLYIAEVSVHRSHQRRGLGAKLIAAAADYARSARLPEVALTTYRDLSWNAPFYARLGFQEIDPEIAHPALVRKLQAEAEAGHNPSRRCIMAMSIQDEIASPA
jgi:GNAT superfamily N-acetyltransferase